MLTWRAAIVERAVLTRIWYSNAAPAQRRGYGGLWRPHGDPRGFRRPMGVAASWLAASGDPIGCGDPMGCSDCVNFRDPHGLRSTCAFAMRPTSSHSRRKRARTACTSTLSCAEAQAATARSLRRRILGLGQPLPSSRNPMVAPLLPFLPLPPAAQPRRSPGGRESVDSARINTTYARILPDLCHVCRIGQFRPKCGPSSANFGCFRLKSAQCRPMSGPNLSRFGRCRPKFQPRILYRFRGPNCQC